MGQCREWFGTTTISLQTSCNGLGGAFSGSVACPPQDRVARCMLPRALGLDTVYNYYASRYSESQARSSCAALGGCILAVAGLRVDRAGAGSGQIDISPPGVTCGGTKDDPAQEPCSHNVATGNVVTLVARPDAMSRFAGYTGGGCDSAATCQLTVTGPATIIARFEPKTMQTPFAWSFGGPAFNADSASRAVIGASGELYFQASFETSATFGGKNLTAGLRDLVIARLEPSTGAVAWSQQIGGSDYDNPAGILLDEAGQILAAATLWRSVTVGSQSFTFDRPTTVLMKLDAADGRIAWAAPVAASSAASLGLKVVSGGSVFMAGTVNDALGSPDVMVTKLSANDGSPIWSKTFGGSDLDFLHGLAVDAAGDVYIVGEYFKAIDFGGGALPATTARNAFAAKLRGSDGGHVWSLRRHEGGLGGGVVVSATGALFAVAQQGNQTGRLARLSPGDGSELWAKQVGVAPTLDLSSDGNPIATSELRIIFDPGFGPLVSRGKHDVMVSKFAAADGAHLWSVRVGGPGNDGFSGVVPAGPDDFYVSGWFEGALELVGRTLTSNGGTGDGFIVRVQP
jgi:hypothetical protein